MRQHNTRVGLAAITHDPTGNCLPGLQRLYKQLRDMFDVISISATDTTSGALVNAVESLIAGHVTRHRVGLGTIGLARRDAVVRAFHLGADLVLYSDLDHLLRGGPNMPPARSRPQSRSAKSTTWS
ncbi:MAG TPA: hypothetical protein VFN61_14930 [Acidimicrobiales bacterium]|nr:hypothetical protein [Acidimicrobiales bacterium]